MIKIKITTDPTAYPKPSYNVTDGKTLKSIPFEFNKEIELISVPSKGDYIHLNEEIIHWRKFRVTSVNYYENGEVVLYGDLL